jgi:hypothetical protein
MFFILSFMFYLLQNQKTGEWNRFCPGWGWGNGGLGEFEMVGTDGRVAGGGERGRRMNMVQTM